MFNSLLTSLQAYLSAAEPTCDSHSPFEPKQSVHEVSFRQSAAIGLAKRYLLSVPKQKKEKLNYPAKTKTRKNMLPSFGVVLGSGGEIYDRHLAEAMNVPCRGVSAIGDWSSGARETCPKRLFGRRVAGLGRSGRNPRKPGQAALRGGWLACRQLKV